MPGRPFHHARTVAGPGATKRRNHGTTGLHPAEQRAIQAFGTRKPNGYKQPKGAKARPAITSRRSPGAPRQAVQVEGRRTPSNASRSGPGSVDRRRRGEGGKRSGELARLAQSRPTGGLSFNQSSPGRPATDRHNPEGQKPQHLTKNYRDAARHQDRHHRYTAGVASGSPGSRRRRTATRPNTRTRLARFKGRARTSPANAGRPPTDIRGARPRPSRSTRPARRLGQLAVLEGQAEIDGLQVLHHDYDELQGNRTRTSSGPSPPPPVPGPVPAGTGSAPEAAEPAAAATALQLGRRTGEPIDDIAAGSGRAERRPDGIVDDPAGRPGIVRTAVNRVQHRAGLRPGRQQRHHHGEGRGTRRTVGPRQAPRPGRPREPRGKRQAPRTSPPPAQGREAPAHFTSRPVAYIDGEGLQGNRRPQRIPDPRQAKSTSAGRRRRGRAADPGRREGRAAENGAGFRRRPRVRTS